MSRISLLVIGLLVTGADVARAQSPARPAGAPALAAGPGSARGSITEGQSGAPVEHGSVTVRSKPANTVVAGAIVDAGNTFNVQGLRPGTYTLRITSMGFAPVTQEITITADAPALNVGTIKLSRVTVALQEVQVSAERAAVSMQADRTSFQAKQVAPAAANASEVLENVPAVQVDADGTVSLRGNTGVVVQINGRPSPLTGTQLGAFLKGLPAGVVDHVEVIPNPSAKYDPEGMAGIINIVLKQNTDLGLSGGLDGSVSPDRYSASGRMGYQSGPLTLFGSYGFNSNDREGAGFDNRTRSDASATGSSLDQLIGSRTLFAGHNLTGSAEYKLNARDVITNSLVLNSRVARDATTTSYMTRNGAGALLDSYGGLVDVGGNGTMIDYDATFKRTFAPRKHELTLEARFNRSHDDDSTTMWRRASAESSVAPTLTNGEVDRTDVIGRQLTLQGDYMRQLGRVKLETGAKSTSRWLDQDYAVQTDSAGNGAWAPSALSNAIRFNETVEAAYGLVSGSLGRAELQAGLRGELADRDFTVVTSGERRPYRYGSVFPSANALYNLTTSDQLKLSYSRRIRRPGTRELNPFPVFFGGAQNVQLGNPGLNPEYTDAVELGYTRSGQLGMVQVNPFIRHTTNAIRFIVNPTDTVAGREVTSIRLANLATADSWGTDVNGSLRLGPKLNGFAGFNVFRMVTDGGSQTSASSSTMTWSARANATVQVLPTVTLQGSYFYRAPMNFEGGRFLSMQMTTFTVRKKIDGDNAAVTLRFTDPFDASRWRATGQNGSVRQVSARSFGQRAAYVGFQYNYGKPPRIRQPEQAQQQQNGPGFP